jgi:hypothetical protein
MQNMYVALMLVCTALFWLLGPALFWVRVRYKLPWWRVLVLATAIGWLLVNGSVFFQQLELDAQRARDAAEMSNCSMSHSQSTPGDPDEAVYGNKGCWIYEYYSSPYQPLPGLLYGPLYILLGALPYWLVVVRRSSSVSTRRTLLLAMGVLLIEGVVLLDHYADHGGIVLINWTMGIFSIPALALVVAVLSAWLIDTQVIQRFGQRG